MQSAENTIRKFELNLTLQDEVQAHDLQRTFSRIVNDELIPELDAVLNAHFTPDTITLIPRIEIDIGVLNKDDINEKFVGLFVAQLSAYLQKISGSVQYAEAGIKTVSREQGRIAQFIYFLETGKMHELRQSNLIEQWEQEVLEAVNVSRSEFIAAFSHLLETSTDAIDRLTLQFNDRFISSLMQVFFPALGNKLELLFIYIREKFLSAKYNHAKKQLLLLLLQPLARNKLNDKMSSGNLYTSTLVERIANELPAQFLQLYAGELEIDLGNAVVSEVYTPPDSNTRYDNQDVTNTLDNKLPVKDDKKIIHHLDEGYFISNAGLVLLHPFLETLFETTGLVKGGSFVNKEAKDRAVQLLQYISGEPPEAPEYLLYLNKLLCGVPDEEHLDRMVVVSDEEKKEADELLIAVIKHWTALKNTSVGALQLSFLQRRAKLNFNKKENCWILRVERSAMDILIDRLPWGFSNIQLPRMPHPLKTLW